ncbi:MAG: GIY-YIG nuclease family protein [Chitinophagaceae bacterium]|nr:GIY-YIG nuclease family protein [Chitinophagaceae bacterium]
MNSPLQYCVYILFSEKDHLLYIGYSANLEKRIENHNF